MYNHVIGCEEGFDELSMLACLSVMVKAYTHLDHSLLYTIRDVTSSKYSLSMLK